MSFHWEVNEENGFKYIETGNGGLPLILLHGLMGALSNFEGILNIVSKKYNVVVPMLPIFEMPLRKLSVSGLVDYVERFIDFKNYDKVHVLGNSLGGHIAQMYVLKRPEKVKSLILTGSSGLFESAMGTSFPKRGNYEYIQKKTESVFYNPAFATKELVDEVFETVNNRNKAIRVVATAKSAVRHNLEKRLKDIKTPTLLVWGKNDEVTPSWVGEKFHELLTQSRLYLVDDCGHAPMMEKSDEFNEILLQFLADMDA